MTTEKEFIRHIDNKGINILKSLLGENVYTIYSPDFEISIDRPNCIAASSFSISIAKSGYVIIDGDWGDTTEEGIDFHFFEISKSKRPLNIKVKDKALFSPCIFHFALESINAIKVFSLEIKGHAEAVKYDSAILLESVDGFQLCFSHQSSIIGMKELLYAKDEIEDKLREMTLRLALTKD